MFKVGEHRFPTKIVFLVTALAFSVTHQEIFVEYERW